MYCEPFVGGGSIFLSLTEHLNPTQTWINDADRGIYAIWESVKRYPNELINRIKNFEPTVEQFFEIRKRHGEYRADEDMVKLGFERIVLHQLSYSGLGTMAGPIGGKYQKSDYGVGCRWSPNSLEKAITHYSSFLKEVEVTNVDALDIIQRSSDEHIIYLDPPYIGQGKALYPLSFETKHRELGEILKKTRARWILSYDDCEEARAIYDGWCDIVVLDSLYSITSKISSDSDLIGYKSRKSSRKTEILIAPKTSFAGY